MEGEASFFREPHATNDHFITPSSRALVVGRLRGGELVSTGAESLLIFASGTRDPRAAARAEITYHWVTAAVLLLLLGLPALW